jgi:hypothetical protein
MSIPMRAPIDPFGDFSDEMRLIIRLFLRKTIIEKGFFGIKPNSLSYDLLSYLESYFAINLD